MVTIVDPYIDGRDGVPGQSGIRSLDHHGRVPRVGNASGETAERARKEIPGLTAIVNPKQWPGGSDPGDTSDVRPSGCLMI